MTEQYHGEELQIALDPRHPAHFLPPKPKPGAKVLDAGCGSGQTLVALGAPGPSFGFDPDFSAVRTGRALTNDVRFVCARSEHLPYRSASFDQVIARLSLPYAEIIPALREIRRVLKPGGSVWFMLHSYELRMEWLRNSSLKEKLFGCYVIVNSLLFHLFQRQVSFFGHQETFQTNRGILRALRKSGFDSVVISRGQYFVVTAVAS